MIPNDGAAIASILNRIGAGGMSHKYAEGGEVKSEDSGLNTAADMLIDAIFSKDTSAAASALRSVFAILEAEPHAEGPHEAGPPPSIVP